MLLFGSTAFWIMLSCFIYTNAVSCVCVCARAHLQLTWSLMRVCRSVELIKKARLCPHLDWFVLQKGRRLVWTVMNNNNKLLHKHWVICFRNIYEDNTECHIWYSLPLSSGIAFTWTCPIKMRTGSRWFSPSVNKVKICII